jgi:hypothetical protein
MERQLLNEWGFSPRRGFHSENLMAADLQEARRIILIALKRNGEYAHDI